MTQADELNPEEDVNSEEITLLPPSEENVTQIFTELLELKKYEDGYQVLVLHKDRGMAVLQVPWVLRRLQEYSNGCQPPKFKRTFGDMIPNFFKDQKFVHCGCELFLLMGIFLNHPYCESTEPAPGT